MLLPLLALAIPLVKLILGLTIGMAFGAILQLGGASQYRKILGTLLLKDLDLLPQVDFRHCLGSARGILKYI